MNMDMDSISEKVGDPQPEPQKEEGDSKVWDAASSQIVDDSVSTDNAADAEQSSARTSTRLQANGKKIKLNLPHSGKEPPWWVTHAPLLSILEWAIAAALFVVAFYYIWLMFLASPKVAEVERTGPPPSLEEFRLLARALPATGARPEWRAEKLSDRWKRIIIHHSATAQGSAESFDRVHREERKWENGLGYHFVIGNGRGMADGEVAVGDRWRKQLDGAHVKGPNKNEKLNSNSIGIALVGNFEESVPTAKQLAALKGLVNYLRKECFISLADVVGHGEMSDNKTLCPGKFFFVDELRLAIANP
jgi:Negative regulator of beta-lactamase expression